MRGGALFTIWILLCSAATEFAIAGQPIIRGRLYTADEVVTPQSPSPTEPMQRSESAIAGRHSIVVSSSPLRVKPTYASYSRPSAGNHEIRPRRFKENAIQGANVGGNPSFNFVPYVNGSTGMCQATLVSRVKDACLLATAGHCLDAYRDKSKTSGKMEIETRDFGNVIVRWTVHPKYTARIITQNNAEIGGIHDMAMMEFSGPACSNATNVKVVPLMDGELVANTPVFWGSNWEKGLYEGQVRGTKMDVPDPARPGRFVTKVLHVMKDRMFMAITDRRLLDRKARLGNQVVQYPIGIKMGDSGGALFVRDEHGQLAVAGVLARCSSNTNVYDRNQYLMGHYSTNEGLAWMREFEQQFRFAQDPNI